MDDTERRELFERLVAILRNNQLGWIVDQVIEEVHLGRVTSKEVETVKRTEVTPAGLDVVSRVPDFRKGSKVNFAATVEYDDREKLILLMDAVTQATNAIEMETEIFKRISALGGVAEAVFYSEQFGTTQRIMSSNEAVIRVRQLSRIRNSLARLREEVEGSVCRGRTTGTC